MTSASIFGIALAPLYAAIAQVESCNGVTSPNVYQITRRYLDDLGRVYGVHFEDQCATDRAASEMAMQFYWKHYGHRYLSITGKLPDYEVLARIHNGGPDGWRKKSTLGYWRKVRAELDRNKKKGAGK